MDQLDLQSALHILVNADMRLAAAVIERPGTQLIDIAVIMLQDTLHGFGVTGAGRVDHKIRQRAFALVTGLLHPRLTSLRHERHQFYTQVFQGACPVALYCAAGHSHQAANFFVSQIQNKAENQNTLLVFWQAGKRFGHKLVVDM